MLIKLEKQMQELGKIGFFDELETHEVIAVECRIRQLAALPVDNLCKSLARDIEIYMAALKVAGAVPFNTVIEDVIDFIEY